MDAGKEEVEKVPSPYCPVDQSEGLRSAVLLLVIIPVSHGCITKHLQLQWPKTISSYHFPCVNRSVEWFFSSWLGSFILPRVGQALLLSLDGLSHMFGGWWSEARMVSVGQMDSLPHGVSSSNKANSDLSTWGCRAPPM